MVLVDTLLLIRSWLVVELGGFQDYHEQRKMEFLGQAREGLSVFHSVYRKESIVIFGAVVQLQMGLVDGAFCEGHVANLPETRSKTRPLVPEQ